MGKKKSAKKKSAKKKSAGGITVDSCLQECLVEFKKIAPKISAQSEKWLLNRFKKNFQTMLQPGPEPVWRKERIWLKQQTVAMAHHAVACALAKKRAVPIEQDLQEAVEFIQRENAVCALDTSMGGWCQG
jgi:hypothetical protein